MKAITIYQPSLYQNLQIRKLLKISVLFLKGKYFFNYHMCSVSIDIYKYFLQPHKYVALLSLSSTTKSENSLK